MEKVARISSTGFDAKEFIECANYHNLLKNGAFTIGSSASGTYWGGTNVVTTDGYMKPNSSVTSCNEFLASGTRLISQTPIKPPVLNHKYFLSRWIKTEGNVTCIDARFELFAGDGDGLNWMVARNQGNFPNWTKQGGVFTVHKMERDPSAYYVRSFTVNASARVWTDGYFMVDLTEMYGTGNEPDANYCFLTMGNPDSLEVFKDPSYGGVGIWHHDVTIRTNCVLGRMMEDSSLSSVASLRRPSSETKMLQDIYAREFREGYGFTNLAKDPSFELGQWGGTFDTAHKRTGSKALKITATTSNAEVVINSNHNAYITKGHIYYARVYGYQETKAGGSCSIYWPIAEPLFGSQDLGPAGQWNMYSWRNVRSSWDSGNYNYRVDFDNINQAGTIWYDDYMLIDLTATFGAGQEPSKEWCDGRIPFFEGSYFMAFKDRGPEW